MAFAPKKILLPLAMGPEDEQALIEEAVDAACSLAQAYNAKIILLNVCPAGPPGSSAGADISGKIYHAMALVQQATLERGRAQLKKIQATVREREIAVESKIVDSLERISVVICDVAAEEKVDLILMNAHARRGLKRLFLGSISERVAHRSPVPVLLIHYREQDS